MLRPYSLQNGITLNGTAQNSREVHLEAGLRADLRTGLMAAAQHGDVTLSPSRIA